MKIDHQAWLLYEESFPESERRTFSQQLEILSNKNYFFETFKIDGLVVGLIAYWDLDDFIFVEHIAINSKQRNNGLGTRLLGSFISTTNKQIVLEVEIPYDEYSEKRVNFYKRLGFGLNTYYYFQPPYRENTDKVPMYMMSFPDCLEPEKFNEVAGKIHEIVYGHKENMFKQS